MIAAALLAQLAVTASAPDTVYACQPVPIVVRVRGAGAAIPDVLPPDFAPFGIVRLSSGPRPDPSRSGGAMSDEYRYVLSSPRAGTFTLAPFEVRSGEATAFSGPLRITVLPSTSDTSLPRIVRDARVARGDSVTFGAMAYPDTVYVGEQATYEVAVFFEDAVRSRLRRNPEFFPPDMRAMLAYELPAVGGGSPRRESGGQCYEAPVFARALFPLTAGRHVIPPARLLYSLTRPYSVWGGEESYQQRTDSVVLVALEPPLENRPPDFSGVVGAVRLSTRLDTAIARVGDPLVLTVRVEGTGNVKLFGRPAFGIAWGTVVPADERVLIDTTARLVRGAKEFDWLVTPRDSGRVVLPAMRYSYFDPATGEYAWAATTPDSFRVAPGTLASVPSDAAAIAAAAPLPLRRELRAERGPPPHAGDAYWLLFLLAPAPALVAGLARVPRRRAPRQPSLNALRAYARGGRAADAATLRRLFVAALAERIGIAPAAIADRAGFSRALRRAGVSAASTDVAGSLLAELDDVAYGHRGTLADEAAARAWSVYRRVAQEARPRAAAARPVSILVAVIGVALLAASVAAQDGAVADDFARAIEMYDARRYREAEHLFAGVAARVPRAPDAWANYGTAAWAADDTAGAAIGWQRALRLEPVALDLRERLRLIPGQTTLLASVPPVPPAALDLLGLALWLLAWSAVAWRVAGRRPVMRGWPVAAALAGVGAVAVAALVDERLAAEDLVLTAAPAPMRALPALSAERMRALPVAEVLRVRERRDGWVRVETDDGRDGWLESSRLLPLVR